MRIRVLIVVLCLCLFIPLNAQKVGLVLSGGGAKGIAHIGMIKALEENDIPIDYITGTSMGAIVGGLYAAGYSPDEMMTLIKSEDFQNWMSGKVEDRFQYYFRNENPTPEMFNLNIWLKDSTSSNKNFLLPSNLINPRQMNIVFTQLFGPASASSDYDFNYLMVPFRCVASDVYERKPIICEKGDLGDAIRASMSFPFVFKPIKLNGVLAYDGGIFDNFPVRTMISDFNPDYIIGSKVASARLAADERDIIGQMENMVMDKTDYSVPENKGLLLSFELRDVNLLDFGKADSIYKLGYDKAMGLLDSIQRNVSRRVPLEDLKEKRKRFKGQLPELTFKKIIIKGVTPLQKEYIKNELPEEGSAFTYEEFKQAYFRLLSNPKISEIIPHAVYNYYDRTYDLHLDFKVENKLQLSFGGLISSQNFNEIYLGATYQSLAPLSHTYGMDLQLGKTYNSVSLRSRTDIPSFSVPMSLHILSAFSGRRYYEGEKIFDFRDNTAFISQKDYYLKLKLGFPFRTKGKVELGLGYGSMVDDYYQSTLSSSVSRSLDKSRYNLAVGSVFFDTNTLNSSQYPTKGRRTSLLTQIIWGTEYYFKNGSGVSTDRANLAYLQFAAKHEYYKRFGSHLVLGQSIDMAFSSSRFLNNYTSTIIAAPSFTPTPHSKMIFNEAFRANQFAAAGIKPIWRFNDNFHLRSEFYAFLPYKEIKSDAKYRAYYGKDFRTIKWMGELSAVAQFSKICLSGYLNYYKSPVSSWNVGFNIGYLLFTPKLVE